MNLFDDLRLLIKEYYYYIKINTKNNNVVTRDGCYKWYSEQKFTVITIDIYLSIVIVNEWVMTKSISS